MQQDYLGTNLTKEIRHCWEKMKIMQTNGEISWVHVLEDLVLLKCPYYLKKPTDSVQSLSKSQGQFSQRQKKVFF